MASSDITLLGHGGGGKMTRQLVEEILQPPLANSILGRGDDAAQIPWDDPNLVVTTDSYVVDPVFFPGGSIGTLAASGTVNDLVVQGARPLFLTFSLIIEEGFPLDDLRKVVQDMADELQADGVQVVTGDTKVVERGRGGGVFINTTGFGSLMPGIDVHVSNASPGDKIIVTGTVGDHGITILTAREDLALDTALQSDAASLWPMVETLLGNHNEIHALRDPTRSGVTGAICDIAEACAHSITLEERDIPVRKEVKGACELLGLDPLNAANEGKALIVCSPSDASEVLETIQRFSIGSDAAIIGEVNDDTAGRAVLRTTTGGERVLLPPSGEDMPRIC